MGSLTRGWVPRPKTHRKGAPDENPAHWHAEVEALRTRLIDAINTIKTSKLGQLSGNKALYDLPWCIVIGSPSAGKSSAVLNSGLQFPFADSHSALLRNVATTRDCDWFFTPEGILLDTAGRYSVHEEDRMAWLGFLDALKRYRPRAPINGIVIAVSLPELMQNRVDTTVQLARDLRQRVQELTERLEVLAPVYVLFTKADGIAGFGEFFGDSDADERDGVWGATLPFERGEKRDTAAQFDQHFDELCDGLQEISVSKIAKHRHATLSPALLGFPLEFASIKPALRSFLATLFDENPFQYMPLFRGFYFTSALPETISASSATDRIARRFGLQMNRVPQGREAISSNSFFLRDLFSKVVFADRNSVRRFSSPARTRVRIVTICGLVLVLGVLLGSRTWLYIGNRQLTAGVRADLDKIVRLQENRIDLQSRWEALDILRARVEQIERYDAHLPIALSLGLYRRDTLRHKLLDEYYNGLRQILFQPVVQSIERFLSDVNAKSERLQPSSAAADVDRSPARNATSETARHYADASPNSVDDAYNALKAYLMLTDKRHVEVAHLTDQITRFWRGWLEENRGSMPRDQLLRAAERNLSFLLNRTSDDNWPRLEGNRSLIDQTRQNLRHVVRGIPARERAYAEIKARAATRFAPMTVDRIVGDAGAAWVTGSHAVPGTFTREAWQEYVRPAIREAASKELQSKDWVLDIATLEDLTLEGSPDQIEKTLVSMYRHEYAREWRQFMQGAGLQEFGSFDQAVTAMNLLGDPVDSPIRKLFDTAYEQTSWGSPSTASAGQKEARIGVVEWIQQWIAQGTPLGASVSGDSNSLASGEAGSIPTVPVGEEFSGLARIATMRENDSLLRGYIKALSKVRTRLNTIRNEGDPGPGARQLMQQTLEGSGSELAEALKYVDEQMLSGMTDSERKTLRSLLVRPLLQSYTATMRQASVEINKVWTAQVHRPFTQTLANRYPFATGATIEASATEIAQVFGPEGAIARFADTTIGPLSVRRGDMLAPRTWGGLGLTFAPEFVTNFARWIAPLANGAAGAPTAAAPQTVFQILPSHAAGTTGYTIEIDGQLLRYRNSPSQWVNFVWPNPRGTPGARITATTLDGRTVEMLAEPGRFGLQRLIATAARKRRTDGAFELSWAQGGTTVTVALRIVSSPDTAAASDALQGSGLRGVTLPRTVAEAPVPAAPVAQGIKAAR